MDWFFKGWYKNKKHDQMNHDDQENIYADGQIKDSFGTSFIDQFDNMADISHVFQHVEEMLNQFSLSQPSFVFEQFAGLNPEETDARAMMLKDPECERCDQPNTVLFEPKNYAIMVDNDIDDTVAKSGWLLEKSHLKSEEPNFAYKRFSSKRILRMADGNVEEQHTVSDGSGNTTSTVRRSIRDQSHEVTTHLYKNEIVEKVENFTNLDENNLVEFERRWKDMKGQNEVPACKLSERELNPPVGDPSYLSLFKKFFSM